MEEENETFSTGSEDIPLRSDARAFSQEELVTCEACLRHNPPTRTSCLYCGAALPVTEAIAGLAKPTLRPLESWEPGFNSILLPGPYEPSDLDLRTLSDLLRLDVEDVKVAIASRRALPIARCASLDEASLVQARLNKLGMKTITVADNDLDSLPPVRVRAVDVTDESLTVYPTGRNGSQAIAWEHISLLVVGRRIIRRLEVAERPDKKRGKEVVDSRELSTDAERLDVYTNNNESGWRVAADNFDFSCLGETKSLMSSHNFQALTNLLRERAHFSDYDDSYRSVRQSLSLVWPLEQRSESTGLQKARMGRLNTGTATTSDNDLQYTRYSRLLHFLKSRQTESKT